jgi:hypothetical protein
VPELAPVLLLNVKLGDVNETPTYSVLLAAIAFTNKSTPKADGDKSGNAVLMFIIACPLLKEPEPANGFAERAGMPGLCKATVVEVPPLLFKACDAVIAYEAEVAVEAEPVKLPLIETVYAPVVPPPEVNASYNWRMSVGSIVLPSVIFEEFRVAIIL